MIESSTQPLTPGERSEYRELLKDLRRPVRPTPLRALFGACMLGAVVGVGVGVESDGPPQRRWSLGALALGVCAVLGGMYARELSKERRRRRGRALQVEHALASDRAEVMRVRATEVVAFEELGDLGPYCAFQVEQDLIVCLGGQDYVDVARFPSEELEIIRLPLLDARVECRGRRLKPARVIPASAHRCWNGPEDGQRLRGSLRDVEQMLAHSATTNHSTTFR